MSDAAPILAPTPADPTPAPAPHLDLSQLLASVRAIAAEGGTVLADVVAILSDPKQLALALRLIRGKGDPTFFADTAEFIKAILVYIAAKPPTPPVPPSASNA